MTPTTVAPRNEDHHTNTPTDAATYERRRSINAGEWDPRGMYSRDGREITEEDWR